MEELEQDAFAHAGGPEQNARLRGRDGETDILKNGRAVEGDGDVAKREQPGRWPPAPDAVAARADGKRKRHSCGEDGEQDLVRRKSTKMMSTEELTTA